VFGFDKDEDGSETRHEERKATFEKVYERFPQARYYFWWVIHNCISHPLIGVLPVRRAFSFHDFTSRKMHPPTPPAPAQKRVIVPPQTDEGYVYYSKVDVRRCKLCGQEQEFLQHAGAWTGVHAMECPTRGN
jgi:hypothetical protein